jgi:hypothetical protein
MPQQLLLEGKNLEALIVRARKEYGPGARVVRAEKVRVGGFLGFFTREHFELTVEISDADIVKAAATRAPVEAVPARTAADAALAAEIADAQAARESMLAGTLGDYAADSEAPYPAKPMSFTHEIESGRASSPLGLGDSLEFDRLVLSLTEQADTATATAPATAREQATATAPPSAHAPSTTRAFVPATFPIAQRQAEATPVLDVQRRAGAAAFRDDDGDQDSGDALTGARVLTALSGGTGAGVRGSHGEQGGDGDSDEEAALSATSSQRGLSLQRGPSSSSRLDGVVLHRWGVFTDVASAVATHCTVPALLALGVPMRCVEDYADLGTPVPLLDVVARFATPPVRRPEPGDLIVVAGPADQALAVAKTLAGWVGLPPTAVVLAGEIDAIRGHGRRIRDETQARTVRARAEKAGRFGEPTIVALGVAVGRRGAASSAPLLAAFDADTAWAVIDATKRPSTYEPSVRLLAGEGRIDGLAAVNVADAQAPCAMLDASLPVAWMDGLPAAGVVWAALLAERIASID